MALRLDLTGKKVGRLTVISLHSLGGKAGGKTCWNCRCDCGKMIIVFSSNLVRHHTKSCGCLKIETAGKQNITHNGTGTREYNIYKTMLNRCYNSKVKSYPKYGGRGIKVCDRWRGENGFLNFIRDMGPRPSAIHSIDRYPDLNGDYGPENTRWATPREQAANTRRNRWIEWDGQRKILTEWARLYNLNARNLHRMLKKKTFEECMEYYLSK